MDRFFKPFVSKEGETISPERLKAMARLIEPWFLFALVWSVGATCDGDSRKKFDHYLRERISEEKLTMPFPEGGLVYDYRLDDGGVSRTAKGEEEEEEDRKPVAKAKVCSIV